MALITTAQAAQKLRISARRVQELIHSGRLPAQQFGRTYVVDENDLKLVADRKPGRPPKASKEQHAQETLTKRARMKRPPQQ
jgi:excisionase family DNA binding protein